MADAKKKTKKSMPTPQEPQLDMQMLSSQGTAGSGMLAAGTGEEPTSVVDTLDPESPSIRNLPDGTSVLTELSAPQDENLLQTAERAAANALVNTVDGVVSIGEGLGVIPERPPELQLPKDRPMFASKHPLVESIIRNVLGFLGEGAALGGVGRKVGEKVLKGKAGKVVGGGMSGVLGGLFVNTGQDNVFNQLAENPSLSPHLEAFKSNPDDPEIYQRLKGALGDFVFGIALDQAMAGLTLLAKSKSGKLMTPSEREQLFMEATGQLKKETSAQVVDKPTETTPGSTTTSVGEDGLQRGYTLPKDAPEAAQQAPTMAAKGPEKVAEGIPNPDKQVGGESPVPKDKTEGLDAIYGKQDQEGSAGEQGGPTGGQGAGPKQDAFPTDEDINATVDYLVTADNLLDKRSRTAAAQRFYDQINVLARSGKSQEALGLLTNLKDRLKAAHKSQTNKTVKATMEAEDARLEALRNGTDDVQTLLAGMEVSSEEARAELFAARRVASVILESSGQRAVAALQKIRLNPLDIEAQNEVRSALRDSISAEMVVRKTNSGWGLEGLRIQEYSEGEAAKSFFNSTAVNDIHRKILEEKLMLDELRRRGIDPDEFLNGPRPDGPDPKSTIKGLKYAAKKVFGKEGTGGIEKWSDAFLWDQLKLNQGDTSVAITDFVNSKTQADFDVVSPTYIMSRWAWKLQQDTAGLQISNMLSAPSTVLANTLGNLYNLAVGPTKYLLGSRSGKELKLATRMLAAQRIGIMAQFDHALGFLLRNEQMKSRAVGASWVDQSYEGIQATVKGRSILNPSQRSFAGEVGGVDAPTTTEMALDLATGNKKDLIRQRYAGLSIKERIGLGLRDATTFGANVINLSTAVNLYGDETAKRIHYQTKVLTKAMEEAEDDYNFAPHSKDWYDYLRTRLEQSYVTENSLLQKGRELGEAAGWEGDQLKRFQQLYVDDSLYLKGAAVHNMPGLEEVDSELASLSKEASDYTSNVTYSGEGVDFYAPEAGMVKYLTGVLQDWKNSRNDFLRTMSAFFAPFARAGAMIGADITDHLSPWNIQPGPTGAPLSLAKGSSELAQRKRGAATLGVLMGAVLVSTGGQFDLGDEYSLVLTGTGPNNDSFFGSERGQLRGAAEKQLRELETYIPGAAYFLNKKTGEKYVIPYAYIGPFGQVIQTWMSMIENANQNPAYLRGEDGQREWQHRIMESIADYGRTATAPQQLLSSFQNVLFLYRLMTGDKAAVAELPKFISMQANKVIPGSIRGAAGMTNPDRSQFSPDDPFGSTILARLPLTNEQRSKVAKQIGWEPPIGSYNILGERNRSFSVLGFASKDDPVANEISALAMQGVLFKGLPRTYTNKKTGVTIDLTKFRNKEGVIIYDSIMQDYRDGGLYGDQSLRQDLEELFSSPDYADANDPNTVKLGSGKTKYVDKETRGYMLQTLMNKAFIRAIQDHVNGEHGDWEDIKTQMPLAQILDLAEYYDGDVEKMKEELETAQREKRRLRQQLQGAEEANWNAEAQDQWSKLESQGLINSGE